MKKRFHGVNRNAKKSVAPRKLFRRSTMTTLAHIIDAMMVSDSPADIGSFGRVECWGRRPLTKDEQKLLSTI